MLEERKQHLKIETIDNNGFKKSFNDYNDKLSAEKINNNKNVKNNNTSVKKHVKQELKWPQIIIWSLIHALALHSLFTFSYLQNLKTYFFLVFMAWMNTFGVTGAAHRYWTHRTFKAKLPLRIIMAVCYASSGMNPIDKWVRDHRVHHKYSETDADPHNSTRGFFFSHIGWLLMQKHPDVIEKGKGIDMSDIYSDSVAKFLIKYYVPLFLLCNVALPICIPVFLWNETWYRSFQFLFLIRYVLALNFTWSVNSFAHLWGDKPYDKKIAPVENFFVSLLTGGEGWHNYHHTFPWDYKAAEYGFSFDTTTHVLNLFAKIGWAYDLKTASPELIKSVVAKRTNNVHIEKEY